MPTPLLPLDRETAERIRRQVAAAVAASRCDSHRTPEHAAWCRHLREHRSLSSDHEMCVTAATKGAQG